MNTGKNYNKVVYGSRIQKLTSKFSVLQQWLSHPEMKNSHILANRSRIVQYIDFLFSIAKYGTTLQDYLIFEFYNKGNKERQTYVNRIKLYKFIIKYNNKKKNKRKKYVSEINLYMCLKKLNNRKKADIFINKNKFMDVFSRYLKREIFKLDLNRGNKENAKLWLKNMDVVFAKPS